MTTFHRAIRRYALGVLAAVLITTSPAQAQKAPAPPVVPAPVAEVSPRDQVVERRTALAAELTTARERIAALPEDAPEARRAAAARELELLERIDLTLSQRLSALDRAVELELARDEFGQQLDDLRATGPTDSPPYSLLAVDAVRNDLEGEQARAETIATAAVAATQAAADAKQAFAEKETARRRAKEAEETNTDDAARAALARTHRIAQLESRLAQATVELRETESRRETAAKQVHEHRIQTLQERLRWMKRSVRFTADDLQAKLDDLRGRESQLRQRLDIQQRNATYFETEWFNAKRRHDESGGGDAALAEEVEARKLAYQVRQREIDAINKQLEQLADGETVWKRRYDIAAGDVDRDLLATWETDARGRAELLRTDLRLQAAQLADIRAQAASVKQRLESVASDAEPALVRWMNSRRDRLREIVDLLESRLATANASLQLHERLLADIGEETAHPTLAQRLADLWRRVESVWSFEITSIDEQPITVGKIVLGLFVLFAGIFASRFLSAFIGRRILPRLKLNEGAAAAIQSIIFYLLLITFTLFAFRAVNIPLTAFTVLGGALAIGIGFGSQNVISNFISGLIMLAERPVRVGDLIQINELHGNVERIGARSTRVRTGSNVEIIVPNSSFLEQNVINWTLSSDNIRISVSVGVMYGSPTREVAKVLRRAVEEHGKVLKSPSPIVLFTEFGDNALLFEVHFWIRMKSTMERRIVESDVRFRIDGLCREAHIVIAFPQRDVHLDTLAPLDIRLVGANPSAAGAAGTAAAGHDI